jgi:alpha-ribazole phosphatase
LRRYEAYFYSTPKVGRHEGYLLWRVLDIAVPEKSIIQHAEILRQTLPTLPIISSPLQRCLGLANALSANAKQDVRLLEMNFGQWQGKVWNDIDRALLDLWANDVTQFRVPGGESFMDVIDRVSEFLHGVDEPHIFITHAGVIRAAHSLLGGLDVMDAASVDVPYVTPITMSA